MIYRLALDLGTNSIGWVILELDQNNRPFRIIDVGVRIFPDGRNQRSNLPLNVERREARGARRNLWRRKTRLRYLFRLLQREGLFPLSGKEAVVLKALDPYELRVKSLDNKLEPYELGRALFHLCVRRGFKSNRKDVEKQKKETADENNEKKEKEKLTPEDVGVAFRAAIKESGARTIGEFLFEQNRKDASTKRRKGLRFVPGRFPFYPLRDLYFEEFDAIYKAQSSFYPEVAWSEIQKAIFYQRKPGKQIRGQCQFAPKCPVKKICLEDNSKQSCERTFKTMPSSIRIRILQEVRNMKFLDYLGNEIPLTEEQYESIIKILDGSANKVSFDTLRKKLKVPYRFNLETKFRESLKGNPTGMKLRGKKYFGKIWDTLSLVEQDNIVEKLINEDENDEIFTCLEKYNLTNDQKQAIAQYVPDRGTTSLCKKLSQMMVEVMEEKCCGYDKGCKALGIDHWDNTVDKSDTLEYYGKVLVGRTVGGDASKYGEDKPEHRYGKISNVTVHVAFNQLRKVVNALIREYGKPEEAVIELGRDLKASRDDKKRMLKELAKNTKRNEVLNKSIIELTENSANPVKYPSRADRLKYELWEELGADSAARRCLYCGKVIGAAELFTDNIEVDHILPWSKTTLDSKSNKTVAHKVCNNKKKNLTPYEAFGHNPDGYNWAEICGRVAGIKNKSKQKRFEVNALEDFKEGKTDGKGFISRQLNDNAYLSKLARLYLTSVCDNVWVTTGQITGILRDRWDLDSILKRKVSKEEVEHFGLDESHIGKYRKNRYDHRHHALDAIVIGLVDRALVQEMATKSGHSERHKIEVPEMPFEKNRADTKQIIADKLKSINISYKQDHGTEGKLWLQTSLAKIKRGEFKDCYANHVSITSLKENDIDNIVDRNLRAKLIQDIKKNPNDKLESILERYSGKTGTRRVLRKTFAQKPVEFSEKHPDNPDYKRYYNTEDYLCAVVWRLPSKKPGEYRYEARYVRRKEKDKLLKPVSLRTSRDAKKICVLYKDDCIEFVENGVVKKARVDKYGATGNKIDIRPIYASGTMQDWILTGTDEMVEKGWKPQKAGNPISVNVLFGQKAARKINISVLGRKYKN